MASSLQVNTNSGPYLSPEPLEQNKPSSFLKQLFPDLLTNQSNRLPSQSSNHISTTNYNQPAAPWPGSDFVNLNRNNPSTDPNSLKNGKSNTDEGQRTFPTVVDNAWETSRSSQSNLTFLPTPPFYERIYPIHQLNKVSESATSNNQRTNNFQRNT